MLSRDLTTTDAMLTILSDANYLHSMARFEGALARSSAIHKVIPRDAAEIIIAECLSFAPDLNILVQKSRTSGPVAIAFVEALRKNISNKSNSAADWLHYGATSQDVLDTALCLQLKAAAELMEHDLQQITGRLCFLAQRHSDTPIIGRTLLQHAQPITLGLKFSQWAAIIHDAASELKRSAHLACFVQLGGATGTLSGIGANGLTIAEAMAGELGLKWEGVPWHNNRNRLVAFGACLGVTIGALSKIARDVSLLMQNENGEMSEPTGGGKGGSSAMPHKRNPVAAVIATSAAVRAPGLVASLISSLSFNEHERGLGGWQSERPLLEDLLLLCHGSVWVVSGMLADIQINEQKIAKNLEHSIQISGSELLLTALSTNLGRERAKQIVDSALLDFHSGNNFIDRVYENDDVRSFFEKKSLTEIVTIKKLIGLSNEITSNLLNYVQGGNKNLLPHQSGFVNNQDMRVYWRSDGHPGLPVLILGNSLGTDTSLWDNQVSELSKDYRVIRFDLPGHGLSQVPEKKLQISDIADNVISILDQLGVQKAAYCGVSVGGQIGLSLAIRYQERLNGLILCCAAAKIGDEDSWNARISRVKTTGMRSLAPEITQRWFGSKMRAENPSELEVWEQKLAGINPHGYVAICAALAKSDLRDAISKIKLPVLCVTGREDIAVLSKQVEDLCICITDAKVLYLDNIGHIPPVEAPNETYNLIRQFMISVNQ